MDSLRFESQFLLYTISTFPIMHLICFPKFCISIVFNFSWDGCDTQEKRETKVIQNFGVQIRCIMGNVEGAYKRTLFTMLANLARAFGMKG